MAESRLGLSQACWDVLCSSYFVLSFTFLYIFFLLLFLSQVIFENVKKHFCSKK